MLLAGVRGIIDVMNRKRVMIIEDDPGLQEIYKINFESAGYEVLIEGDGLSGASEVVDKQPSVILLDIMMPNMNGFDFLKAVKENTDLDIPVIVCSNLSDKETQDKAFASGASAVLLKVDYSGKELVQKVEAVLLSRAK